MFICISLLVNLSIFSHVCHSFPLCLYRSPGYLFKSPRNLIFLMVVERNRWFLYDNSVTSASCFCFLLFSFLNNLFFFLWFKCHCEFCLGSVCIALMCLSISELLSFCLNYYSFYYILINDNENLLSCFMKNPAGILVVIVLNID